MKPYYQQDGITIYHGDCREVLQAVEADVMVTDPPYGCSATTGWGGAYDGFSIRGDNSVSLRDWLLEAWDGRPMVMFGSPRVACPDGVTRLVWWKGEHTGMGDLSFPWKPDYEDIYIRGRGFHGSRTSSVLRCNARTDSGRYHPTEKPEALLKNLILKCPDGVVVDPCMGGGTTLRAAKDVYRQAVGIEIEERYCEIAAKRLSQGVLPLSEETA